MKNFEFENTELKSLSNDEIYQIDGGVIGVDDLIGGVLGWIACEVIDGCLRYASGERKR